MAGVDVQRLDPAGRQQDVSTRSGADLAQVALEADEVAVPVAVDHHIELQAEEYIRSTEGVLKRLANDLSAGVIGDWIGRDRRAAEPKCERERSTSPCDLHDLHVVHSRRGRACVARRDLDRT